MNFVNVRYSAGDGIRIEEATGPVDLTNSTIEHNRGHGLVVFNTSDGRVFINETRLQFNWGDGIQYSVMDGLINAPYVGKSFLIYCS